MGDLKELMQIDWWYVFVALCLLLFCIKVIWSLLDWLLFEKLGVETRKMKQKREESDLLKTTAHELNSLRQQHEKDECSFRETLTSFIEETRNAIKVQDGSNHEHWETSKQIRKELADTIKELANSNRKNSEQINSIIIAQKEMLAEKINEKYKYYISIGGIPEDEYDEFVSMHDAYNGVGGNSNGDAKFKYCIGHLPMIPVKTKLDIIHKDKAE